MKQLARQIITFILPVLVVFAPVSLSVSSATIVPNLAHADINYDCADGTNQSSAAACASHGGVASASNPACDRSDGSTSCVYFGGTYVGNCQVRPADTGCKTNTTAPAAPNAPVYNSTCVTLSISVTKSDGGKVCGTANHSVIVTYLILILKFLAGAVGGVIVLMIIIGGIQYVIAAGNPTAIKSAKSRIINAITALVLFLMMYAILNFIIPGGIFT